MKVFAKFAEIFLLVVKVRKNYNFFEIFVSDKLFRICLIKDNVSQLPSFKFHKASKAFNCNIILFYVNEVNLPLFANY